MKLLNYIPLLFVSLLAFASCSSDNGSDSDESKVTAQGSLDIPTQADTWTYVSLQDGKTIGTCALGDSTSESQWAKRKDWDIAVCNGIIRTNSGSSGQGKGGITQTSAAFDVVDQAPDNEYQVDQDTIQIW